MKNLLFTSLSAVLLIGTIGLTTYANTSTRSGKDNTELSTCKYGQCKGTAKSTGNRCKHCVSNAGDSYCSQHK
ncbi:MAG: hypothetical protein EP305_04300 [Bacteroidetes bacterium]|nr:MAG: hypothetical protein EP305_04300 [Bacteroidota bacterium]